jgi:sulfide:quinone oxidoreductase
MKPRILVLGAGFGGLELATVLSETLGDSMSLTLIDKSDSFFIGFSKFDVMFNWKSPDAVRMPYSKFNKPGVTFRQETILSIDPENLRVTTDRETYEADYLVVALGVQYDLAFTPGLIEGGHEFYSFAGAERLREFLPTFKKGQVVIGVADTPFRCPPAPSEAALLLHEFFVELGIRDQCEITIVLPFEHPIPPSPDTPEALTTAFEERGINVIPDRLVDGYDPERKMVLLIDGNEIPADLFIGIPKHRVPKVVEESGLAEKEWIPVDEITLETKFPGVYAIGDVTSIGTPKAGVFAEGAARVLGEVLIAEIQGSDPPPPYDGIGTCYIEFGGKRVGKVTVNFLSAPKRTGYLTGPSKDLIGDKVHFAASRYSRWFGEE